MQDIEVLRAKYERLRAAHALSLRLVGVVDESAIAEMLVDAAKTCVQSGRMAVLLTEACSGELTGEVCGERDLAPSTETASALRSGQVVDDGETVWLPLVHEGQWLGALATVLEGTSIETLAALGAVGAAALARARLVRRRVTAAKLRTQWERQFPPLAPDMYSMPGLSLDPFEDRCEATVLVVDVRSSLYDAIVPGHGETPARIVERLNRLFDALVKVLFLHHGFVDRFIGDSLIACFGVGIQVPAPPLAAVRCAVDMRAAIARLQPEPARVHVAIGVDTGELLAAWLGSRRTKRFTVIGDAVIGAARLCKAAAADEIFISEATLRGCGAHVVARPRVCPAGGPPMLAVEDVQAAR